MGRGAAAHLHQQGLELLASASKCADPAHPACQHTELQPQACTLLQPGCGGWGEEGVEGKQLLCRLEGCARQVGEGGDWSSTTLAHQAEAAAVPAECVGWCMCTNSSEAGAQSFSCSWAQLVCNLKLLLLLLPLLTKLTCPSLPQARDSSGAGGGPSQHHAWTALPPEQVGRGAHVMHEACTDRKQVLGLHFVLCRWGGRACVMLKNALRAISGAGREPPTLP